MSEGFLGRWSRRKQAVREGLVLPEPAPSTVAAEQVPAPAGPSSPAPAGLGPSAAPVPVPVAPEPPTLADAQALTPQSDFRPFLARGVAPQVRNAAVKKLFADPRFNVMDGLDVYIDDYSRPDPLPAGMLGQLASARVMNLVAPEPPALLREDAGHGPAGSVAESSHRAPVADAAGAVSDLSGGPASPSLNPSEDHADTDLQLQPDHAARREGPGPGAR